MLCWDNYSDDDDDDDDGDDDGDGDGDDDDDDAIMRVMTTLGFNGLLVSVLEFLSPLPPATSRYKV